MQTRCLEYIDITVCLEGKMNYYLNGERIELHAGDAIVFPKGSTRMRARSETPVSYASFNVIVPSDTHIEISGLVVGAADNKLAYLIELFSSEWISTTPRRPDKCAALFTYIYNSLLDSRNVDENLHVKQIKHYIKENISKEICLTTLSELLHFAPQYICYLFKKNTGMTITEYINQERVKKAKQLILSTDSPLYTISELCGFTNYNYFSNTFRKITGTGPAGYRKHTK